LLNSARHLLGGQGQGVFFVTRTRQDLGEVVQCGCFRGFVSDSCNGFESAFEITRFGLSGSKPGKRVVHCLVRWNGISGPEGFLDISGFGLLASDER
jgi:hypothetical protein